MVRIKTRKQPELERIVTVEVRSGGSGGSGGSGEETPVTAAVIRRNNECKLSLSIGGVPLDLAIIRLITKISESGMNRVASF
ncbi:hypothetical protein N665_5361s0001 [Sinapis alba]|nr:hypothetical protein N665_5361s0001 [Sinapis alba]